MKACDLMGSVSSALRTWLRQACEKTYLGVLCLQSRLCVMSGFQYICVGGARMSQRQGGAVLAHAAVASSQLLPGWAELCGPAAMAAVIPWV